MDWPTALVKNFRATADFAFIDETNGSTAFKSSCFTVSPGDPLDGIDHLLSQMWFHVLSSSSNLAIVWVSSCSIFRV